MFLIASFMFLVSCSQLANSVTFKYNSFCGWQWQSGDGMCYYTSYTTTFNKAVSICNSFQSQLLGKLTQLDREFITQRAKSRPSPIWSGLVKKNGKWTWSDGQKLESEITWQTKPVFSKTYALTCLALTSTGLFSQIDCNSNNRYLCQVNKYTNGTCPSNFVSFESKCVFISSAKQTNRYSIYSLKYRCRQQSKTATPVAIDTDATRIAITKLLPTSAKPTLWWTDGSIRNAKWLQNGTTQNDIPAFILNNWSNSPDNLMGNENCAAMYTDQKTFTDMSCNSDVARFICKKKDRLEQAEKYNGKFGCGQDDRWIRGGNSCYLLKLTKQLTWSEADKTCKSVDSHLLRVNTKAEAMWLSQQSIYMSWTDACYKNEAWRNSDNSLMNDTFASWDKEPAQQPYGAETRCGAIGTNGLFYAKQCQYKLNYVCQTKATDKSRCTLDWTYFNGSCYYISLYNQTNWWSAERICNIRAGEKKGFLYIPYFEEDTNFVVKLINNGLGLPSDSRNLRKFFWTGITDEGSGVWGVLYKNSYQWVALRPDKLRINWFSAPENDVKSKPDGTYCAMYGQGKLFDEIATKKELAICERRLVNVDPTVSPHTGAASRFVSLPVVCYSVYLAFTTVF